MMHLYTHNHKIDVLKRNIMRLCFLVFFSLGIFLTGFSQYIYNAPCGNSMILASDVLANALDGVQDIPPGHRDGTWLVFGGLTFSTNNEFAEITDAAASTTYNLQWNSVTPSKTYDIQIIVGANTAPTVNSFSTNDPTHCGNYSPNVIWDITGGTAGYTLQIDDELGTTVYNQVAVGNNVSISTYSIDKTFSLVSVVDAAGCVATGLPQSVTFTVTTTPVVQNVTWGSACTDVATTINLLDSEAGIQYVLRYDDGSGFVDRESWTSPADNDTHSFTSQNSAGTYQVYAIDPCGGADVPMNGAAHVVVDPPLAYGISIMEAAPYCAGNAYTVSINNSQTGVTYTLRDPLNNPLATVNGNTGSSVQFPTTTFSTSGDYTVEGDNGCTTTMSNTLSVGAVPSSHTVSGGSVCFGSNLTVGLLSSTAGVNYTLKYDDGTNPVTDVRVVNNSPGGAISFTPAVTAVGTYYVEAQDGIGCTSTMNGSATVNPLPTDIALNIQGDVCPSGVVSIGTVGNPTEGPGTTYILMRDGVDVISLAGNNGVLSFGSQTTAGKYTVRAEIGSCSRTMTGELNVFALPTVLNLTANKTEYCNGEPISGVNLSLGPIEALVTYVLQTEVAAGVWADVAGSETLGVANSTISWDNLTADTYRVVARITGGCELAMNNQFTITEKAPPTASFANVSPVSKCESDPAAFSITIDLTGTPPFDFEIEDGKGGSFVVGGHLTKQYIYTPAPVPTATTTYNIVSLQDAALCAPTTGTNVGTITVNPDPNITFNPTNPVTCAGIPISVTASGAGAGGAYVWSSTGFAATGPTINVAPSNNKDYTVTAISTDGCSSTETITVTVNQLPVIDYDTPGSIYEYCEDVTSVAMTVVDPLTSGGDYTSTTLGAVAAGTNIFNPQNAGIGTHPVTYTFTDANTCTNQITKNFVVNALPVVNLTGLATSYCANAGLVNFNANPNGASAGTNGTFSITGFNGAGNKGTWWDQDAIAGNGAWINVGLALASIGARDIEVCYTYSDANSCATTICQTVTLYPDYNSNLSFTGLPATLCQTAAPVTLTPYLGALSLSPVPAGETVTFSGPSTSITNNADGTATFDPSIAGAGTHRIYLDYEDANGCTGQTWEDITIGTPLSLPGFGTEYCSSDAGPYVLSGSINGNPPVASDGTTFDILDPSGATISANVPNGTYNFEPSVLFGNYGGGVYQTIYKYTDGTGCDNTLTTDITIIEELDATFTIKGDPFATAQSNYCIDDANAALLGHADLSNAKAIGTVSSVFTGNGVSGGGVSGGFFNPGHVSVQNSPTANTITHTVIHTVNGKSCPTPVETFDVYVPLVDVSISGINASGEYCTNEGTSTINVNGTDALDGDADFSATKGGSSTAFLTDNGDNTATLDPSVGAGVYEITMVFTKTAATGGCAKTVVETVEVYADNPVTFSGVSNNQDICVSSAEITLRGDMPNGGVGNFSITPVVAGGIANTGTDDLGNAVVADDGVAILDPSALPIGPYTIRYDYTNGAGTTGCSTYAEKTINIVGAPTNIFDITVSDKAGQPFGAYCNDDAAATKGVKIGLSGSNTGVTYELLLGGVSLTPKVEFTGNGLPFFFQDVTPADILFTDEGVYTVRAVQNSCDAIMNGSILVEQYELVLQEDSKTNISCIGLGNGEVTLKTTGGSGSYEYSDDATTKLDAAATWQASPTFKNLTPGIHTFSVRDLSSAACEKIQTLTVNIVEPSAIVISQVAASNTNVGCTPCTAGVDCEGSATITITGGTPDYVTYTNGYDISWSTGGTDFTETKMPSSLPGSHSVTVTDGNGCVKPINITIGENPALTLAEDADPALHINNVCEGGISGSYVVTATGGSGTYQFSLTDPATTAETWLESNYGAGDQYQLNSLSAGTYNIWVRDRDSKYNRCIAQVATSIVITDPTAVSIVEESQIGISCNGATDGSFIVRATDGESSTYEFSETDPALGAVWVAGNSGADGYQMTNLGIGTYTVWVRDAANPTCDYTSVDVTISDIAVLDFDIVEHTNVSCKLGNDGRLEVLAKGGSGTYVYNWVDGSGNPVAGAEFIKDLVADDYTVTISDVPNGCGPVVHTFTVSEPSVLSVNLVSNTPADCSGQNNGEITIDVVGGTPDYITYPGVGYKIDWSNGDAQVESINSLAPGNYEVNVTDGLSCPISDTYTVTVLNDITLTVPVVVTDNTCNSEAEGSLQVQVKGGSGIAAGNYQFKLLQTVGAVVEIDWSYSVTAPYDNFTFSNLSAGDYDILVRDANNTSCEYPLGTYTISEPTALGLVNTGISDVTCNGTNDGAITVKASGGSGTYQFNLDNGVWAGGDLPEDYTATNIVAGTHTIWVRDSKATGCEYKLMPAVTVNQPDPITLDIDLAGSSHVSCFNAKDGVVVLTASGGSGNYDYSKDNGLTWDVGVGATYTYTGLAAQAYIFKVRDRDALTCATDFENYTVTQPLDFSTTLDKVTHVNCNGESTGVIELSTEYSDASGGAFTYSINGGLTDDASPLTGLPAGTYVITVIDNSTGCIKNNVIAGGVAVTEPVDPLTIGAEWITDVQCYGESNGSIDLQGNVTGGTIPYNYVWYKKGTPDVIKTSGSDKASNLSEGDYYVIVEDNVGCTLQSSDYEVNQPNDWDVKFTETNLTSYNGGNGVIDVHTHTGGNGVQTIEWYSYDGVTETHLSAYDDLWLVNTFNAGTYRFKITDALSPTPCKYISADITLTQPDDFVVVDPNTTKTNVSCYGANDGEITVQVVVGNDDYSIDVVGTLTSGAPNYTNTINNQVSKTFTFSNLEAGSYYIEIEDVSGKSFNYTVPISQPDELTVTETSVDVTCNGNDDGQLSVVLSGELAGATISWTADNGYAVGPQLTTVVGALTKTDLEPGEYQVVVNNNNGCPAVTVSGISIVEPNAWNVNANVTDVSSFGNNDGIISVNNPPTGNTAPYQIEWTDLTAGGTGLPHPWVRSNLTVGSYEFKITDQGGAVGACSYTETVIVSGPDELLFNLTGTDAKCYGESNGKIVVDITSGNANFDIKLTGTDYLGAAVLAQSDLNNSIGNHTFNNLVAGNYSIMVTDSEGESLTKTITIDHLAEISVNEVSSTPITCNDGNDGAILIEILGRVIDENNATINWTRTNPVGWTASGSVAAEKSQTGLEAGIYTINVEDKNLCTATPLTITLTESNPISASIDPVTHVTTNGASDGRIFINNVVSDNGVKSIVWYKDDGTGTFVATGVTGADNNNIDAGIYRYKITDNNDCTLTSVDIPVTKPGALTVNVTDTDINCFGADDGEIGVQITSGNAPYTTELTGTPDDGSAFTKQTSNSTNALFKNLKPGSYQVDVTDNASQTYSSTITISENAETNISETLKPITCFAQGDGKIDIVLAGRVNGSETWEVIDPNGVTLPVTAIAAGMNATIPGDYKVFVTNQDGCILENTYTITEPNDWNVHHDVTDVTPTGNNNGSINIDILEGNTPNGTAPAYNIIWTGPVGAPLVNNQRLQTGLLEGTYSYQIQDANGCTYNSGDFVIYEPEALNATVTPSSVNILCYGDAVGEINIVMGSGNEPYTVVLTGNEYDGNAYTNTQSIPNKTGSYLFNSLKAGVYQVQITDNVGNVYNNSPINILQPKENIITESVTHLTCNAADKGAGEILLNLNRAPLATDMISWTGPSGLIKSGALTGADMNKIDVYVGGNYTYTFTDVNGCPISNTINVIEPSPFNIAWTPADASIFGLNDGSIDVHTVSGNNGGPYTIEWSDDATVTDFLRTDLLAGTYEFTITDNAVFGCDTTISGVVIGQPEPLNVTVTPKDAICYGDANGEIQVEFEVPNNGGLTYTIIGNEDDGGSYTSGVQSPTSVNSTITGLEAGTYTIDAYDAIGTHYLEENIRIEQEVEVTLTGTSSDITCYGEEDGSVTVALNGRSALSSDIITWSGSNGTFKTGPLYDDVASTLINHTIDPVAAPEVFNVTVTSATGCTYSNTFEVEEPNELVITVDNITNVTCNGGKDGAIDVSVTGRSGGGYVYAWEKKDASDVYQPYTGNTASLNGLFAGVYRVTVRSISDNCEVVSGDIIVIDGSELTIEETLTHITTCVGDNSGTISVSIKSDSDVGPYIVKCTGQPQQSGDGSADFVFDNLIAGTYVIEVSDSRGVSCATVTKSVTLTEPANAFAVNNQSHDISCDPVNITSGTFSFDVTGGVPSGGDYNYQILLPEASIAKPVNIAVGATHSESVSNLSAGTYNLTVLDLNSSDPATCAINYQFTLEHIVITNDPVVNTTCAGINNGAITGIDIAGASVNYTYSWTTTDGGIGLDNSTLNQSGLSVGTYVLEITDPGRAGCSVTKTFTVGVDNTIVITPTIKDVSCNGDSDGAITIDVAGVSPATTYLWTGPGIVTNTLEDQVSLSAGNYTVEVTSIIDGQTCIADEAFVLSQPNPITYTASFDYTSCDPYERTLRIKGLKGGKGNYTYLWDGPTFSPAVPTDPKNIEIYEGGLYTITIKDENKCEVSKSITVPNEVTINPVVNHVTCNGGNNGSIVLNVSGGSGSFDFAWTAPSGYTSTDRNIDDLYAGTYTVIITDNNEDDGSGNCFRTFDIVVGEPTPIVIDPTVVHTSCFGKSDGQIEIEVSGGNGPYTYQWSPVIGSNLASNKDQYNLSADTYSVTVTDDNGCNTTSNIDVEQDDEIVLSTVVTETLCDGTGGAINLTVTGGSSSGFKYDWNSADGSGLFQGDEDQTGLTGGTYSVVVSDLGDGRSCTATISETLTHAISIINDVVTPVTCSGNDDGSISYDVIGGDGNYIYSWNAISGDPTRIVSDAQNQSGLSEGEYKVTITDGRTDVTSNDCSITKTFIVTASTGLSVNVAVFDSKMCFGEPSGKLEASVTGGSGNYKYYWNGVEGTAVLDNQIQGIYGLEVVDQVLGCNFVQSYEIKGPLEPLSIDLIDVTDILCYGEATGAINVTVSGGTVALTSDYVYTWTTGTSTALGSNPTNLLAGTYNLTVTDDNGCTITSGNIEVTQPPTHVELSNPVIVNATTPGGTNGQITVDVSGGVAPYTYEWYDSANNSIGVDDRVLPNLGADTYRVIVTDDNGCTFELTGLTVTDPDSPLGFNRTVNHIAPCNGDNNGIIEITSIYGGVPIGGINYRIQISGPGVNVDENNTSYLLENLSVGDYVVTITDGASEVVTETIKIKDPATLKLVTAKVSDVQCFGTNTGEIEVTVSGGKPDGSGDYYVTLESVERGLVATKADAKDGVKFSFANIPAGNYTVTAYDHAEDYDNRITEGCYTSEFTLITEPSANVNLISVSGDTEICTGDSYDLSINTSNWNFASQGNLIVTVYDDFKYDEHTIDESPFVFTVNPVSGRTYKITNVYKPGDATCLQGESTGNQVQLTVHDLPTAKITGPTEVCEDGTVQLTVDFTGTAPFSFTWQDQLNGTSNTETGITSNQFTFTDSPSAKASYVILNVSDNNTCSNSGDGRVEITINNKPDLSFTGSTSICSGDNTDLNIVFKDGVTPFTITYKAIEVATSDEQEGTLVVSPTAGNTYLWNVSPTVSTKYSITSVVDANGCSKDITVPIEATVTVNPVPALLSTINSVKDDGGICQGTSGIDYSVAAVTNATGYRWTVDAGMNIITGDGTTDVIVDFDRDFTGGYIRVYAENACGVSPTIERWVNADLLPEAILAPTGDQNLCEGETGILYSVDAVANATSYEWSVPAGFIIQGDDTGTSIVVNLDPDVPSTVGDIYVRPVNDCSSDEPWSPALTVTVTPLPIADAGSEDWVCETIYTLNAASLNVNEAGEWTIIKGSGQYSNRPVDQVRPNASIYNLSQGENTFVWTVKNTITGCSTSDTVTIHNDMLTVKASVASTPVCDGEGVLIGTPVSTLIDADEGYWTIISGDGTIAEGDKDYTTVSNLDPGLNTLRWTIRKNGCESSADVDIINDEPTEAIISNASDVVITLEDLDCQTNSTSLKGSIPTAGEKGYWRIESGSLTIDNVDNPDINITNIAKGDHILSWNILNGGCLSQTFVTIRNNALDVYAGIDKYTCDGTIQLNGTDDYPSDAFGVWAIKDNIGSGFFNDANSANTEVTGLSQANGGRNVFTWTLTRNGCASVDSVVISNYEPSPAEISGGSSSFSVCDYEYDLHAVAPTYGTGVWSVVGGQGKFDNPADPNTKVTGIAHGDNTFRWTVTNQTCSSSVEFTVTNLHVDSYAGADTAVCGKIAELNATAAPLGANGSWNVVEGDGGAIFNPSPSDPKASATSLGYGKNVLAWTVEQSGCTSSDTVVIYNNKPYEVSASPYIYEDGSTTTLRAEIPDVGSGLWTLLEGRGDIVNPTSPTTDVTNLLPNYNYFRWTVTNVNCTEYVDVAVQSGVLADADAGLDQLHLCEDFTTLQANDPEGTYGEWTTKEGSATFENSNSAKTKITDIRSGRNVFVWTLRFAGGSTNYKEDSVIIINNKPSTAIAGIDIVECGETTVLNAREPEYGSPTWSILSGGGVFTDVNDPKTGVSGLAKGENIFKYQIQNDECFSYDTISVFNYEPSEAYAGEDLIVCADSAEINPEIPKYGEGKWRVLKGAGKGKDALGNETDEIEGGYVYGLAPGENILVWEVQVPGADPKCTKSDSITIINNEPSISFAGHNRSICTDTVSLSGSLPIYGEGTWKLISGSGEIADSSIANTLVTNLGKGKNRFRWTIDNEGCTSITDVEISNNLIEAFGGYEQINCADTAVLEGNNPSPGEGTWGILGGSGSANFDDNESPYTKVRKLDKGENILTWTINYEGCQSVSQVKITNNEPSKAFAGDNKATCNNSIMLGASIPTVGDGLWTIRTGGGKFVDDVNASTKVDSLKFGDNVFRWTVEHEGCVSYDDVQISFNTIEATVGGTQEICSDRTYLEANSALPGVGTWSVIGGSSQAKFVGMNDPVSEVYDLAKGNNVLRWTINNKGCITYAEVNVVNNSPSTAYAGNTQELCVDYTTLDATPVSIGTGKWEVLTGAAIIATGEGLKPKATITGLSKGDNVFRWTVTSDNGLCTSIDDVLVTNNEPSEPYAGADEEYCSPTVVLKAAVPDFGEGMWSIIEGGGNFNDPKLPNATISNLNEGLNTLRWTITQGQCTKSSDIVITNNTPTTANAGPDIEDCKDYAFLDANTASQGTGYWTLISGNANFVDEADPKTKVEGLTHGDNILMWNIKKGSCISYDSITVFNQIPSAAMAGTDKETCEDYLTLNANDPINGNGTWTVISGNGEFDDVTSPTTIVRNLGLGENRFKWTVAYGECTTEDEVEIYSNKADPYAGEDDISYESSYELKASNPGDLGAKWTVVAGNGSFKDETFFNTVVSDLSEGVNTFRWQMDVNGCITYDDVSIEYRVVPDAGFIVDTTQGCYPLTIQFTNYSTGGSNYSWDFDDGQGSTSRNPVHTFEDPGDYVVTLTAPGPDGVNGEYQKIITVHDHPIAEFSYGPDVVYVPGDELRCSSLSVDAVKFLWDFGDGTTSTAVNPVHEYTEEDIYTISLTVESEYGCTDQIVKGDAVEAVLQGFIKFPTAFTPRSDGTVETTIGGGETNTVFRPVHRDVDEYKLQIFNRWGQLIYESNDIEEGWNGFFNGELSPQAVYVWKAKGRYISGKEFNKAGSVLLVR